MEDFFFNFGHIITSQSRNLMAPGAICLILKLAGQALLEINTLSCSLVRFTTMIASNRQPLDLTAMLTWLRHEINNVGKEKYIANTCDLIGAPGKSTKQHFLFQYRFSSSSSHGQKYHTEHIAANLLNTV